MARWLSLKGVTEKTSLSESTIRRLIAEDKFPRAQEATAARKVFEESAVEAAMESLIASRQQRIRPEG